MSASNLALIARPSPPAAPVTMAIFIMPHPIPKSTRYCGPLDISTDRSGGARPAFRPRQQLAAMQAMYQDLPCTSCDDPHL